MTPRIDRKLSRASHRVIDRPNGKGEGLVLVYRDRSPRGSSIRISTSFESLWRPGLFFGGWGVLFGVGISFLSPYVRSRITRRTRFESFFFSFPFLPSDFYVMHSWAGTLVAVDMIGVKIRSHMISLRCVAFLVLTLSLGCHRSKIEWFALIWIFASRIASTRCTPYSVIWTTIWSILEQSLSLTRHTH